MRQFIFFLCVSWLLVSCNDNDSMLNVPIEQIEFANTGGEQTFTIDCNDDWSIYGIPTWLTTSRQSGINTSEVTFTAPENVTGLDREQIMTVRTNDSKNIHTINVVQYAFPEGRVFNIDDCSVKYFSGPSSYDFEDSIVIRSSARWKITGPDWLTMKLNDDRYSYSLNGDLFEGSGNIYVRCSNSNSEEEAKRDTIVIQKEKSEEKFKIPVIQLGINDVKCYDVNILSDVMWTKFKYGNKAEYIDGGIIEGIVSAEQVGELIWTYSSVGSVRSFSDLKPNTDYTICTRVKRSKNTHADKINVEYIHTASDIDQPKATIENVKKRSDGKWGFSVIMNQYAKGFYQAIYTGNSKGKASYVYSFSQLIGSGGASYYDENKNWTTTNSDKTILTWAVGEDGKLSNFVDAYKIYASVSASAPMWKPTPQIEHIGTFDVQDLNGETPTLLNINENE